MRKLFSLFFSISMCSSYANENMNSTPACHKLPSRFQRAIVPEMINIKAAEFMMGTDKNESYPSERPSHKVNVSAFWIDATEVTNENFRIFVEATSYKTIAERIPDWEEFDVTHC